MKASRKFPVTSPPSPWYLPQQVTWSRSQLLSKQALGAAACQGPGPCPSRAPSRVGKSDSNKERVWRGSGRVSHARGRKPSTWGVSEPSSGM